MTSDGRLGDRLALFALGLGVAVAFFPGAIAPATTPRWAFLAVMVPSVLFFSEGSLRLPFLWTLAMLSGLAASIFWTPDWLNGADDLAHAGIMATVLALGWVVRDLRPAWTGLMLGVSVSAVIAVAQALGWEGLQQAVPPAGLFINKNFLAEAGVIALIAAVGMRMTWAIPGAAVAVALGASVGAIGALFVVLAVYLWGRDRRVLALFLVVSLVLTAAAFFGSATPNAAARLDFWAKALSDPRLFGHGIGSFTTAWPFIGYAHSEPLQFVYELGVLSVPIFYFGALALGARYESPVEWHVLLAILTISLVSFPLHLPLTAFAASLAAGRCLGARHLVRLGEPLLGGVSRARA